VAAEKTVCGNSQLLQLDAQMVQAYQDALRGGHHAAALGTEHKIWVQDRNACGSNTLCLKDEYHSRLVDLSDVTIADNRWGQTWHLDSDTPAVGSTLVFAGKPPQVHFNLDGFSGEQHSHYAGTATIKGEKGHFNDGHGCRLRFLRSSNHVLVLEREGPHSCGQAPGVSYQGTYLTNGQFADKPKTDLLTLHVLETREQNTTAHALLVDDYQKLVDSAAANDPRSSIVVSDHDQLWIGLLTPDATGQPRIRYYTNVPEAKKTMPAAIRDWRDRMSTTGTQVPVDYMPEGRLRDSAIPRRVGKGGAVATRVPPARWCCRSAWATLRFCPPYGCQETKSPARAGLFDQT
jgi:hypothetical protein